MKVLIVSDIHGGYSNLLKVIDDNKDFDLLLILGDILSGYSDFNSELIDLLNSYNTRIIAVKGNCDRNVEKLDFSMENEYIITSINNKIFYLTHGHLYDRYSFPDVKFDVYVQGHSHVPMMEVNNNVLYLNPGSITSPRGGSSKSYIMYMNNTFYLKEVETNKIIKEVEF